MPRMYFRLNGHLYGDSIGEGIQIVGTEFSYCVGNASIVPRRPCPSASCTHNSRLKIVAGIKLIHCIH